MKRLFIKMFNMFLGIIGDVVGRDKLLNQLSPLFLAHLGERVLI